MDSGIIEKIRSVRDPIQAKGALALHVYGSRARGDDRRDSDVHVFVDYDPATDFSIIEMAGIKRVLEGALGLNVHITTREGLSPAFRGAVEREAIKVL